MPCYAIAVFFTQQVSGPRVVPADVGPEPYEAHAAHDNAGASRLDPAEFVTRRKAAKPKRECWKGVGKGMKDHGNSMKYHEILTERETEREREIDR